MPDKLQSFLTAPESKSPVFLDRNTVAMLSTWTGDPQIWTLDLENGIKIQRTFGHERIWRIAADETKKAIMFCMDVGGNENEQIFILEPQEMEPKNVTKEPYARHMLGGIHDDKMLFADNARSAESFDICQIDLSTGKKIIIVENHDHYNWPADGGLSPNGQWILYNKLLGTSDNALWMANTLSGANRRIGSDERTSAETNPVWQPDSCGFYLLSDREGEYVSVAHYSIDTGILRCVLSSDWDAEGLALSGDGQFLAVIFNDDGYSDLKIFKTNTMSEVSFPKPAGGIISPYQSMHWRGHLLLFTLTTADQPENVWLLDLDESTLKQLTQNNVLGVRKADMVKPSLLRFSSFDGLQVPCWLYTPKGMSSGDLPLVVDIHGGPEGQEVPGFNPFLQYLLSQGIAVAAPNIRGSTGYGKTYTHLDDIEKRLDSVRDIEELVRYLIVKGIANKEKIAVMGVSYGGFMTLSCVTRLPDLWACAIDTVGMFNLVSFLENTAPYRRAHRENEYGSLARHRKVLYDVSPISKVDNIIAPLMVVHGQNDPRVPVSEAEQVVTRLQNRSVAVEYLCYADEGHGIGKLKNKLDCYPKMAGFLKKHLSI